MRNKVVLNSVPIIIEGTVSQKDINPWSSKMSMGTQDFADYQPASVVEYHDARGGIGKDIAREQVNRVSWSESMELTKDSYFSLGALVTVLGAFGTPLLLAIDFEGATYFFGTSVAKYNNAGTLTNTDGSPLATPTDVIVFTDETDSYIIYCNGSDVRYASIGHGGSSNWAALSTSDVKFMCAYDKRLIGVNSTGTTVFYSARGNCDDAAGGAMSFFKISGPWTAAYDIWEGKALDSDEPILYMLTDIGLATIDFWTRVAYPTEVTFSKTSNAMKGCYWNASIICSNGPGLTKASRGTFNDTWGPDADDGLPTDYIGYIYDMKALNHWLVIAVSGGTKSTILKRHSSMGGWQEVYSSSNNIRALHHSNITSPHRLYFGDASNVCYIDFPDVTKDFTRVSGFNYATTGSIIFPRLAKVSTVAKIVVEIQATTEDCDVLTSNHDEKFTVYYRIDNATSWTSAGTFTTSGRPTPIKLGATAGAGLAFYDIQFKVVATRGSASTTVSPKLKSLSFFFTPNPGPVYSYTFNMVARGEEAKRIIDELAVAKALPTLMKFYPNGDTTGTARWVKIESLPRERQGEGLGEEALFTVVVTEVVSA